MMYFGEIISLVVAMLWTAASLSCEIASRRLGVVVLNVWRLLLALMFSMLMMWVVMDSPLPLYANTSAWIWLLISGVVGYAFGDWCLFNSYLAIGSRYGQLLMTLAPAFTAVAAWTMLGQQMSLMSLLAMAVTMAGIAISVLGRGEGKRLSLGLPLRGVLFGIGAAMGQGIGLVLSKIGLDHYTASVPADVLPQVENYLPFGSNLIRCIAGLVCYTAWFFIANGMKPRSERRSLATPLHDMRSMAAIIVAVVSGPFVGVSLSLMAVQYTGAGIASTLMATTPILILLPSRWLFNQPITLRSVVGAIVSVVGVALFFV